MSRRSRTQENIAIVNLLKDCANKKDLHKGTRVHADILKNGLLEHNSHISTSLINMYAKCGMLFKAHQILEETSVQNVASWNALIAGYADRGRIHDAFVCFERMQTAGVFPNGITFICILKACGNRRARDLGQKLHEMILQRGLLQKDIVVATALVTMYAKCGALARAQQVLEGLPVRDVVSWNALITGFTQNGQFDEALNCIQRMQSEGLSPDIVTYVCLLKACSSTGSLDKGKQIHEEIMNLGLLGKDIALGNALVDLYARCGLLSTAQKVLEELPVRDNISWNTIIGGYVQHAQAEEALNCFDMMQNEGLPADVVTFICVLKACGTISAIEMGKKIHEDIMNRGLLDRDISLATALVDMYAKCGALGKAHEVLMELPSRNTICWNALITGYVQERHYLEALSCYDSMQSDGLCPDSVTFISILKAIGNIEAVDKGEQIHKEILSRGLLTTESALGNALVDMYAKCGVLGKAREVLEGLSNRNVVTWSALISGYDQHGQCHEALNCYERMQMEGLSPNAVTFISILKACSTSGAIEKGIQIHDEILSRGFLEKDSVLGTTLIDMYARCGMLSRAQKVLDELPIRDVVSWNTLLAGYAQQGCGDMALDTFERMLVEGIAPDEVTLVCVLNACSHAGLLCEIRTLFGNITQKYGITLSVGHHTCMVVFFGCAGHFDNAVSVIEAMPSFQCTAVWLALLGSCSKWSNMKLGVLVFDQVIQLDISSAAAYVLMGNIFRAADMKKDVEKLEAMRKKYTVANN